MTAVLPSCSSGKVRGGRLRLIARLRTGDTEGLDGSEIATLGSLRDALGSVFTFAASDALPMLLRLSVAGPPTARSLRRRIEDVLRIG